MKVGKATRLKSAPGRSWAMMCESTNQLALDSFIQLKSTNNKHTTPLVRLDCGLIVAALDVIAVGLIEGRTSIARRIEPGAPVRRHDSVRRAGGEGRRSGYN